MPEATNVYAGCESFLEALKTLAWCKQGDDVLVAVHKATPEIIDAIRSHEVRVIPGNIPVKIAASWLSFLIESDREGNPVPVLIVSRADGVELWYRRHKSFEFPYDTWQDPAAAAYERDRAFVPADSLGDTYEPMRKDILGRVKPCPPGLAT